MNKSTSAKGKTPPAFRKSSGGKKPSVAPAAKKAAAPTPPRATSSLQPAPLQRAYQELCQKKLTPSVPPDSHLMHSLATPNPILEIAADGYQKQDVAALIRFLSMPEVVRSCSGVVFKAADKAKPSSSLVSASKPPKSSTRRNSVSGKSVQQPFSLALRPPSDFIKALAKFLFRAPKLSIVSFNNVQLTQNDLKILSKAISLNSTATLTQLNFIKIPLGDSGLAALAPALASSKAMSIRVVDCSLSDASAPVISNVIRSHGSRRDEAVWSAGLRGDAVKPHGPSCPTEIPFLGALVLDFSVNKLGDDTASAIAEALKNDCWIVGINLGGNEITDRGARALIHGLKTNNFLRALVLAENKITTDSIEDRLASAITSVADTPPPAAAQHDLVLRAMRNWARWKIGKESINASSAPPPIPPRIQAKSNPTPPKPPTQAEAKAGEQPGKEATLMPNKVAAKTKVTQPSAKKVAASLGQPPISLKDAADKYRAARDAISPQHLLDFESSGFSKAIRGLSKDRAALKELKAINKPPAGIPEVATLGLVALNIARKPLAKLAWHDFQEATSNLSWQKALESFDANDVLFALSSKGTVSGLKKVFKDGSDKVVQQMHAKSSYVAKIAILLKCIVELLAAIEKEDTSYSALVKAGIDLRKSFLKAKKKVPKTVIGTTPKKTQVSVTIPRPDLAPKPKVEKKASGASAKSSTTKSEKKGTSGNKREHEKVSKDKTVKDEQMFKLESMVDKITKEIKRLEDKISSVPTPSKKLSSATPTSSKKSPKKSPKKFKSPAKASSDPELMEEISSAVASRLKELWSITS